MSLAARDKIGREDLNGCWIKWREADREGEIEGWKDGGTEEEEGRERARGRDREVLGGGKERVDRMDRLGQTDRRRDRREPQGGRGRMRVSG